MITKQIDKISGRVNAKPDSTFPNAPARFAAGAPLNEVILITP
jgi:hypothetical protein